MVSQEVILKTITAYFAANNALDVEGFVNAFASDAVLYNAGEVSPISGQEAVRQVAEQSLIPFQKMEVQIERIFIMGSGAAVFYTGSITAKNGRKAQAAGIDVFEINDDGKIQSIRFYFDPAPIAALFLG
jgi:steroid Delta-isomerase